MSKKEQIINLASEYNTYSEIARKVGVSRQYVSQILSSSYIKLQDFRKLTEDECVYPALRNWWNENRMTIPKFMEAMGLIYHDTNTARMRGYFSGQRSPRKDYIDHLLSVTRFTYEQLFNKDGG